jgi:crotonobetainyl-CoA:carnitine CoA-transferase CaiB-like acyl-CoA transferase
MTSITPFGQEGPYRDYKGTDLIAMALGGIMYINGEPEREPLRFSFPLAYPFVGAEAAVATMIAYYHQRLTGEGQYVDVSMQQTTVSTLNNAFQLWDIAKMNQKRTGTRYKMWAGEPSYASRGVWPCKDGFMVFLTLAGLVGAKFNSAMVDWMEQEGIDISSLKGIQWEKIERVAIPRIFEELLGKFFLTHARAELMEGFLERGIIGFPVFNAKDIYEDPQLKARDFWKGLDHPELGVTIFYPGGFSMASETPPSVGMRSPRIGEHNCEIYGKGLGFSKTELCMLKASGVI